MDATHRAREVMATSIARLNSKAMLAHQLAQVHQTMLHVYRTWRRMDALPTQVHGIEEISTRRL